MRASIDLLSFTNYTIKNKSSFFNVPTLLGERFDNEGKVESVSGQVIQSTAAYAGFGSIK